MLPEVRPALTVLLPENFLKQKLNDAPGLLGAGQVRPGTGPSLGRLALECFLRSAQPKPYVSKENFIKHKVEERPRLSGGGSGKIVRWNSPWRGTPSQNRAFPGKLNKTKVEECHNGSFSLPIPAWPNKCEVAPKGSPSPYIIL